jgi:hypothetical protein
MTTTGFVDFVRENIVWIAIAILVLWLLYSMTKKQGDDETTPGGGAPA